MTTAEIVTLCVLESLALFMIVRLWLRKRRMSIAARLTWSIILLIPLFGLIIYGFLHTDPDEHPYDTDTTSGAAESQAHGGGQGHD